MLQVNTPGLLVSGMSVGAVGAHQGAATAAAMPAVSMLNPSGVDEVSVGAAFSFNTDGLGFGVTSAEGTAMLTAASQGMIAVSNLYDVTDLAGASEVA